MKIGAHPIFQRNATFGIDLLQLERRCSATCQDYFSALAPHVAPIGDGRANIVIDRGESVLGVAHLDHVQQAKHFRVEPREEDLVVYNPRLDNRLGVYLLLDLLPELGLGFDVLLTMDEEIGESTASKFAPASAAISTETQRA